MAQYGAASTTLVTQYRYTHMVKQANRGPTAPTPTPAATVTAPTTVVAGKATPGILAVKAGVPLRGARASWYAALQAYNGQPVAAFLAHCAANPPSLPKSGVAEKPQGWLGWFVRSGIASVQAAPPQG